MGYDKNKRPVFAHGSAESIETLTSTDAGVTLKNEGVSFITSASTAGSNVYVLGEPGQAGLWKTIVVDVGTTDAVDIVMAATADTLFGSTFNLIRFTTLDDSLFVTLVARTSTQWALAGRTSTAAVTLAGTTVTTG